MARRVIALAVAVATPGVAGTPAVADTVTQPTRLRHDTITAAGVPSLPVAACPATLVTLAGTAASAPVSATDAGSTFAPIASADATPQVATCDVAVSVLPITPIHDVQGDGATSPLVGEQVAVDGVVTATISRNDAVGGAFVQEPDGDADTDPSTSEGVFVFCAPSCPPALAAGDRVQVTGVVAEFPSGTGPTAGTSTEIDTAPGGIVVQSSANALPAAVAVTLPASGRTDRATTFEAVESMLTTIAGRLTVSEFFQEARFGQIVLVAGPRPFTYTQVAAPSVAGNVAFGTELASRRIVLDDASDDENDAVTGAADEPYPYPTPGLSVTNRFRAGDTIDELTGVMQWAFGAWRERPLADRPSTFTRRNVWPSTPPSVGGRLKLAGFNVLNYFATIDTTASNTVGDCGPTGGQDCRGADSEAERQIQLAKIVASLEAIDADVVGLTEIQNDNGAATKQIVEALNAATAAGRYDDVRNWHHRRRRDQGRLPLQAVHGDAGRSAARSSRLPTTRGSSTRATARRSSRHSPRTPPASGSRQRSTTSSRRARRATVTPTTATAPATATSPAPRPPSPSRRSWPPTPPGARIPTSSSSATSTRTRRKIRSARSRRPATSTSSTGTSATTPTASCSTAPIGYLDHALADQSMAAQVTDVGEWHSNADENPLFDYNDTIRDAGEAAFERESAALPVSLPDPRRASDHDPVIVGLSLASLSVDHAVVVQSPRGGGTVALSGTIGTSSAACPTLSLRVGPSTVAVGPTMRIGTSPTRACRSRLAVSSPSTSEPAPSPRPSHCPARSP